MNPAFLFIADVVLLARLPLLLSSAPSRPGGWMRKTVIELLALLALDWGLGLVWAGVTIIAANLATVATVHRFRHKESAYLLWGFAEIVLLSVWLSPASGIALRPVFADLGAWLYGHSSLGWIAGRLVDARNLALLAGLLIAGNEANLVIRAVLEFLKLKPAKQNAGEIEYNRGRVIGIFERALIYAFVITGQYASIGLIMAAKAFTRFKKLDDQDFAEYVLIGTLLSAGVAMAVALLVKVSL